jgi:hypothetical protein
MEPWVEDGGMDGVSEHEHGEGWTCPSCEARPYWTVMAAPDDSPDAEDMLWVFTNYDDRDGSDRDVEVSIGDERVMLRPVDLEQFCREYLEHRAGRAWATDVSAPPGPGPTA